MALIKCPCCNESFEWKNPKSIAAGKKARKKSPTVLSSEEASRRAKMITKEGAFERAKKSLNTRNIRKSQKQSES